uniref:Amine oxidase domain-containing protein n=1 Tax=Oryza meridionalis TaxID=40149 RepID=A0A0E0CCJ2_9ORYZ
MAIFLSIVLLSMAQLPSLVAGTGRPRVIIIGAGISSTHTSISVGKRLSEAGITDILILEATDHIGGRMHKQRFAGVNVEIGANWVEGVNGEKMNPIWHIVNSTLKLRNFLSDFDSLAQNVYKNGGLCDAAYVQKRIDLADEADKSGENLSATLHPSGRDDMSILSMQRLNNHLPNGPSSPVDMAVDYFTYDYEFAEPPRVTSLRNSVPLPTFTDFGDDSYFVADQRGYEAVVYYLAGQYLEVDMSGNIVDARLHLNKVVREISYSSTGVTVKTEDNSTYQADYVMVSASLGVLQSDLIQFKPQLPSWKILAIYQFDMAVYTKIFEFEKQYPDANVLLVTVTDEESRRIEQQPDSQTKAEIMEVVRSMFPDEDVPDATDILVPRWWSDRFFRGSFSNWPIGVSRYEYDQLRAPVGRVYFTGEHTSERYNGYVHGAFLAGIDSAEILINCAQKNMCKYNVRGKQYDEAHDDGHFSCLSDIHSTASSVPRRWHRPAKAGKRLWEAGITDVLILEATDRIGGRMHKQSFAGVNVEIDANWVEGVNGEKMNPIWPIVNSTLKLRSFRSDFDSLAQNVYKEYVHFHNHNGGLCDEAYVQKRMDRADEVDKSGENLSATLHPSGRDDMSILSMQRLNDHLPNGPSSPVDMAVDYFTYDYEFAEPPRVTSLQNTVPLPTFTDFGDDNYFVADQRGYESVVHHLAGRYLNADKSGNIADARLKLNKVVREISYSSTGVTVKTEDNSTYQADYVMVSASLGVLQSDLIEFKPQLPSWKILAIYQFDMAVYTKIFVKFPKRFWPEGAGREFFLYASTRRGYYGVWQEFEKQYPDANVLLVTVTDEESRRIEQQPDSQTKAEIMEVVRSMFPDEDVPDATDILVPRWWSDRFFRGSFSNWPIGVSRYEYDQLRAPVGRVYFTGEHTSERYNGYVHGAFLAGIDSAEILINCAQKKMCKYNVGGKHG